MGRGRGLSFNRKRKVIQTSMIQNAFLWVGECLLAFAIGCVLVYYFMTSLTCVGQAMEPVYLYAGVTEARRRGRI